MPFVWDNASNLTITSPETPESIPAPPGKLPKVVSSKKKLTGGAGSPNSSNDYIKTLILVGGIMPIFGHALKK